MTSYQKIYNKVKRHLLRQKTRAVNEHAGAIRTAGAMMCRYRTDDGKRCAVGCLIPHRLYAPFVEGVGVSEAFSDFPMSGDEANALQQVLVEALGEDVVADALVGQFLERLQLIHDDHDPEEWGSRLKALANEYGLQP